MREKYLLRVDDRVDGLVRAEAARREAEENDDEAEGDLELRLLHCKRAANDIEDKVLCEWKELAWEVYERSMRREEHCRRRIRQNTEDRNTNHTS